MQQQQQKIGTRETFNIFYQLVYGMATCLTPITRSRFGPEALGMNGFIACILYWVCAAFMREPGILAAFWWWLLFVICRRLESFRLRHKQAMHSHQSHPWLGHLFTRSRKGAVAVEALFWGAVGIGLMQWRPHQHLSLFIFLSAASMILVEAIHDDLTRRRVQAMMDAHLEQQYVNDLYRERRWF